MTTDTKQSVITSEAIKAQQTKRKIKVTIDNGKPFQGKYSEVMFDKEGVSEIDVSLELETLIKNQFPTAKIEAHS